VAEDYSGYANAAASLMGSGKGGGSGDEQTAKSHAEANQNIGGINDSPLAAGSPLLIVAFVAVGVVGFLGLIFLVTKLK